MTETGPSAPRRGMSIHAHAISEYASTRAPSEVDLEAITQVPPSLLASARVQTRDDGPAEPGPALTPGESTASAPGGGNARVQQSSENADQALLADMSPFAAKHRLRRSTDSERSPGPSPASTKIRRSPVPSPGDAAHAREPLRLAAKAEGPELREGAPGQVAPPPPAALDASPVVPRTPPQPRLIAESVEWLEGRAQAGSFLAQDVEGDRDAGLVFLPAETSFVALDAPVALPLAADAGRAVPWDELRRSAPGPWSGEAKGGPGTRKLYNSVQYQSPVGQAGPRQLFPPTAVPEGRPAWASPPPASDRDGPGALPEAAEVWVERAHDLERRLAHAHSAMKGMAEELEQERARAAAALASAAAAERAAEEVTGLARRMQLAMRASVEDRDRLALALRGMLEKESRSRWQLQELSQRAQHLEGEIFAASRAVAARETDLGRATEAWREAARQAETLSRRCAELQAEAGGERRRAEEALEAERRTEHSVERLLQERSSFRQAAAAFESECARLRAALADAAAAHQGLSTERAALAGEAQRASAHAAGLESQLRALRGQASALDGALADARAEVAWLRGELSWRGQPAAREQDPGQGPLSVDLLRQLAAEAVRASVAAAGQGGAPSLDRPGSGGRLLSVEDLFLPGAAMDPEVRARRDAFMHFLSDSVARRVMESLPLPPGPLPGRREEAGPTEVRGPRVPAPSRLPPPVFSAAVEPAPERRGGFQGSAGPRGPVEREADQGAGTRAANTRLSRWSRPVESTAAAPSEPVRPHAQMGRPAVRPADVLSSLNSAPAPRPLPEPTSSTPQSGGADTTGDIDALERELLGLSVEKSALEAEYAKMPAGTAGKTRRERERKAEVEARLEVLNKEIARVRLGLRKMGVR